MVIKYKSYSEIEGDVLLTIFKHLEKGESVYIESVDRTVSGADNLDCALEIIVEASNEELKKISE